jgi:hypothetical protein
VTSETGVTFSKNYAILSSFVIATNETYFRQNFFKMRKVSGSMTCPILFGNADKPLIIVESELDAILLQQIVGDICGVVALGGVGMKPDVIINKVLCKAPVILCALDFDEAGKKKPISFGDQRIDN